MKEIVIASTNKGKVDELVQAFSLLPVKLLDLSCFKELGEPEETGKTFTENAVLKAKYYAEKTHKACLADDSGLEVDALHGAPGVFSARYAGPDGDASACNAKLLKELEGVEGALRTARFKCVLAFVDEDQSVLVSDGSCEGLILHEAKGLGGFGYDPLFFVPEIGKTLAEISMQEKTALSHRGHAVRNMTAKLAKYLEK